MKFRTMCWEEGKAYNDEPCVMATIECIPNWFMRTIFRSRSYYVDVYGEKRQNFGWNWYYAKNGHEVEHHFMDTSRNLYSYLCHYRRKKEKNRQARVMLSKINKAKKC